MRSPKLAGQDVPQNINNFQVPLSEEIKSPAVSALYSQSGSHPTRSGRSGPAQIWVTSCFEIREKATNQRRSRLFPLNLPFWFQKRRKLALRSLAQKLPENLHHFQFLTLTQILLNTISASAFTVHDTHSIPSSLLWHLRTLLLTKPRGRS